MLGVEVAFMAGKKVTQPSANTDVIFHNVPS